MKKIDDSVDADDYDEEYDESESEELEEKKKGLGFFISLSHIIFGIIVLVLVIGAIAALAYSGQKYNRLNEEVIEKTVQLDTKTEEATSLQEQLNAVTKERDDLKTENDALQAKENKEGSLQTLLGERNSELISTKRELQEKVQELKAVSLLLNNSAVRDEVVEEFRNEYNDAVDRLYDNLNKACVEAVDEVIGDNKGSENKKAIKREIADEVDIEHYKAGLFNVTN